MTIKLQRIKVNPKGVQSIMTIVGDEFGSCCRSTIFDALSFKNNSDKALRIRELAVTQFNGKFVKEEVAVW